MNTFEIPTSFRTFLTELLMKINHKDDAVFKVYVDFRLKFVEGKAQTDDIEAVWKIIPYEMQETFRRMCYYYTAIPSLDSGLMKNAIEQKETDIVDFLVNHRKFTPSTIQIFG